MHSQVRFYLSTLFYYTGLVKLMRWCSQRSGRSLTILYYHSAVGKNLRSQWLYLRRHYHILSLEAALEELQTPYQRICTEHDHRPLLAITFDDGYHDNYTHAFALAAALEIPITIFLIPGYTGLANAFWWADRFVRLAHVDRILFEEHIYCLSQPEGRKALAQLIAERVGHTTSKADQEQLLFSLCELLALPSSALPRDEPAPLLTWPQIREMEASGWVSFGAHTIHHVDLQHALNPAEVQREVGECRTLLEQRLRYSVNIFAYPHGHIGDYGLHAVKQAEYKWAVTTMPGHNTSRSESYLLKRRSAHADKHVVIMAAEVAGIWNFFTRLKKLAKHSYERI